MELFKEKRKKAIKWWKEIHEDPHQKILKQRELTQRYFGLAREKYSLTGREIQMMYEKEIAQKRFDVNEVFDRYTENDSLKEADIFHLYDTGEECIIHNDGYHDSRHFRLIAFNTETMEKSDLGTHDGIQSFSPNSAVKLIRVFADGSFFVGFYRLQKISNLQCVRIE